MQDYLLRGEVADGQFDTEAAVTFIDVRGKVITTLASRSLLYPDSHGRESLRVRVLAEGEGYLVAEIPGDVYGATRDVAVAPDLLEPLAAAE